MNTKKVLGVVRHVLTFGGGMLVVSGKGTQEDAAALVAAGESVLGGAEVLVGSLVAFAGLVASFFAPEKKA